MLRVRHIRPRRGTGFLQRRTGSWL